MKKLAAVLRLIDAVSDRSGKLVSYLLYPLMGLLAVGVVARYFFNSPIIWIHDVSTFMYGALGVLVGAYVLRHHAHIRMDVIYNRLSPRGRSIVDLVTGLVFFFIIIVLLWKGIELAEQSFLIKERTATGWRGPIFPVKVLIPIATVMLLLQGIAKFIRDLIVSIRGRELP